MKKKLRRYFEVGAIFVMILSFISPIQSVFSDVVQNELNISTSSLNIQIRDFEVGTPGENESINWRMRDSNENFNTLIVQDDVLSLRFVVENLSNLEVDITGIIELSFLNEQKEKDVVLLYPGDIDNSAIKTDQDKDAIIGFGSDDSHQVNTNNGGRYGYQTQIFQDSLSRNGESLSSKQYTYKIHLSDTKIPLSELKQILEKNFLGIGIKVNATSSDSNINLSDESFAYGEVNTDMVMKPSLTLQLIGDAVMYVNHKVEFVDPGAVAFDEYGASVKVTTSNPVDSSKIGRYEIKYTAQHGELMEVKTRIVYVTDGEAPVITPKNDTPRKNVSSSLSLSDLVNVSDNVDTEAQLRSKLVITTPPDYSPSKPGTYHICYNVTDSSGLAAIEKCIDLTIFSTKGVQLLYENTIVLTSDGRVFASGFGGSGQIGNGLLENKNVPTEITKLQNHNIVDLSGGMYFAMALSEEGRLFIWGSNAVGVQGNGVGGPINSEPAEITGLGKIKQIDGNYYTPLVLNESGDVYVWGTGERYASGLGIPTTTSSPTKMTFPENAKIKYINQGFRNGYAISVDNQLYSWGNLENGLNLNSMFYDSQKPINVTSKLPDSLKVENIKEIASGETQTYILTHDGVVYAWGANNHGQLGQGDPVNKPLNTPTIIGYFPNNSIKIDSIISGQRYGIAIDTNGIAYAWGESVNNAFPSSGSHILPKVISNAKTGKINAAGAYYMHSALINEKGELYVIGSNAYGKLGIGSSVDQRNWVKVEIP